MAEAKTEIVTYIYVLKDPRIDPDDISAIRYVGKVLETEKNKRLSGGAPEYRRQVHVYHARQPEGKQRNYHSARWIRKLISAGLEPTVFVVETVVGEMWVDRERHWIAFYRSAPMIISSELLQRVRRL